MTAQQATAGDLAALLGLLSLDKLGPTRVSWLLAGTPAAEVLQHLRAGRLPPAAGQTPPGVTADLIRDWMKAANKLDGTAELANCARLGIELIEPSDASWPLGDDPEPPALLFAQGRIDLLGRRPAVAIVGTRRCSAIGRNVAQTFGAELAEAGLSVVSGLASGIDGAAHKGALSIDGPAAVAVVGSGIDVVYPRVNAALWRRVSVEGLLLSESPPGTRPARWRFPARNRLIAGLADVVVVVESHLAGGSLLTVGEAIDRGVTVMAVPGSVTSPASAGSNQLLIEGAPPACSTQDILDQLPGSAGGVPTLDRPSSNAVASKSDVPTQDSNLSALARTVLAELSAGASHIDDLVGAHRVPIPALLAAVDDLERAGLASLDGSTVILATPSP
jgi:DNA processing protein